MIRTWASTSDISTIPFSHPLTRLVKTLPGSLTRYVISHLSMTRLSDTRSGRHLPNETSSQPKHTSTDPSPLINQETEQEMEKSYNSSKSPTTPKNQWDGNRLSPLIKLALLLKRRARLDLPMSGYLSWRQM
jgi:hypothetical protein